MGWIQSVEVFNGQMTAVETLQNDAFELCYFNHPNPQHPNENHDSLWIGLSDEACLLLCIADGAGGHRLPSEASRTVLAQLKQYVESQPVSLDLIIHAIEAANHYLRQHFNQARTTLAMAIIEDQCLRSLHIGDSKLVIIGGRGKLKYETIGHNLAEICTDSGLTEYIDSELEVPSHVVTNMMGDPFLRMDLSTKMDIAPNDTIVIGSDGLFDNITLEELCTECRSGTIEDLAKGIIAKCRKRMENEKSEHHSKPDDISFIIYRRKPQISKED